ncbi:hypothetical protein [Streptomyces sp. NPDC002676]
MPGTRMPLAAAGALALLCCVAAPAAADPPEPPMEVGGTLIHAGADGSPREVFCPAMQHVFGGGFALTASNGNRLSLEPADLIESRPNDHATGWIVAVRKTQLSQAQWNQLYGIGHDNGLGVSIGVSKSSDKRGGHNAGPADLTIHLVCSDESTMLHGA